MKKGDKEFYKKKIETTKENKKDLINIIVEDIIFNIPHSEGTIKECLTDYFSRFTQKELKDWLGA